MKKYYIQLFSPHGLIRFNNPEIGRDSDTGGQVKYLVELINALSTHEQVRKVDLFTRLIVDNRTSPSYAKAIETINDKARIVRIESGGKAYKKKEALWGHLNEFIDNVITFVKTEGEVPDIVHGHYADGNYIANEVSKIFGSPFVATGHSLGRNKQSLLLANGLSKIEIDKKFNLEHRIKVEEEVIANADMIIASTESEVLNQYKMYNSSKDANFVVIPPGVNTKTFYPYYKNTMPGFEMSVEEEQALFQINHEIERFLYDPNKPLILSIGRADERKNFETIIEAYGADPQLQAMANLAIFAGIRKDISKMPESESEILMRLLLLLDKYDLYGKLAIPKRNDPKMDVPAIYRIAARKGGVFINGTSEENFGLTIIEAGASGLPVVAAPNGGPKEIIEKCSNGLTTDVESPKAIAYSLKKIISDETYWRSYSNNGIQNVNRLYSWDAHVNQYIENIGKIAEHPKASTKSNIKAKMGVRFSESDVVFISDIDGTLIGDGKNEGLEALKKWVGNKQVLFGLATGRNRDLTEEMIKQYDMNTAEIFICSAGAEIYYSNQFILDKGWLSHISYMWKREGIVKALKDNPKLKMQEAGAQKDFKLSYYVDSEFNDDDLADIYNVLDKNGLRANILLTENKYLDLLPIRASKGSAIKYLSRKWNFPISQFITAGNSGNDIDMLTGKMKGIVVSNYSPELQELKSKKQIYFAQKSLAAGVLEGLKHYTSSMKFMEESERSSK